MKTPHKRRDGARPAVPPDVESRPADGPDHRSDTPSANADLPSADRQSAPDLNPRQKRLLSKAAYRARRSAHDAFREKERERVKEWRLKNRDKTRAQKRKARSVNYHRPFVAIDSEGQNYPDDIVYDGVRYPKHETYLWGAAADDDRPPLWLSAAETHGLEKRPLDAIQILDPAAISSCSPRSSTSLPMSLSIHSGIRGRDSAVSLLKAGTVRMRPRQRRASQSGVDT